MKAWSFLFVPFLMICFAFSGIPLLAVPVVLWLARDSS
jgi:hypothetical protein